MKTLIVGNKEYFLLRQLMSNEDKTIYQVKKDDDVYKIIKFSNFSSFKHDLDNWIFLKRAGIVVPKLVKKIKKELTLIFKWIDGKSCLELLAEKDIDQTIFEKLFLYYRFARFSKFDIDYLPTNFVVKENKVFYVSTTKIPANPQLNLENYGIFYWVMSKEAASLMKKNKISFDQSRILSEAETKKKIVLLSVLNW